MIYLFFERLVLPPFVGLPQGVTEVRPPEVLPSPPPCGWSIGFIATPLTLGLLFNHLERPALPNVVKIENSLETTPIVAKQFIDIVLCSPELSFILPKLEVFSINCENVPADLLIVANDFSFGEILCIRHPIGIFEIGKECPFLESAFTPDLIISPTAKFFGAII